MLIVGSNILHLPRVDSTNTYLKLYAERNDLPEGTVVYADAQLAGKGQQGNSWIAEPGKNLTFSVLLHPKKLVPKYAFQLNKVAALAVWDLLTAHGIAAKVKWPNDIMIGDKKVAGILIENMVQGHALSMSVMGIGLNVQQAPELPTATHMCEHLAPCPGLDVLLEALLEYINARYLQLMTGSASIDKDYEQALYRMQEVAAYTTEAGPMQGKIIGVDDIGRLQVAVGEEVRVFNMKEIAYVFA